MKVLILILTVLLTVIFVPCVKAEKTSGKRFDFSKAVLLKKEWVQKGKQFGVPMTAFSIVPSKNALDKRALAVKADSSSGFLVARISDDVWQKYPVMRWRWRIIKTVSFKDKELDDQAVVLYFGDGTMLKQYLVAYRWEHFSTPGHESLLKYGMGATTVYRFCMRNRKAEVSRWYEEKRNVVEDFKKAFGRLPVGDCALTIGANSQYSKSNTLVEIDFIEFLPAAAGASPVPAVDRKIAERKK